MVKIFINYRTNVEKKRQKYKQKLCTKNYFGVCGGRGKAKKSFLVE